MENIVLTRIEQRVEGRVAYVTVNNPDKRNRLGAEGKDGLKQAFEALARDDELRVAVLTGAGERSFVSGSDIAFMAGLDAPGALAWATKTHLMCKAVRDLPVPVIARINGYCFGSGMELGAACDLRIGADHAQFGMPEVRYGIPSGMEACLLPQLIGWGRTRELVLTGRRIGAADAHAFGYLESVVPMAELDTVVEQRIAEILQGGPRVIRAQKKLCQDWERMSIVDGIHAGIRAFAEAYRSDEPRRMMEAFMRSRGK